jgi:hypothetical protein
MNKFMHNHLTHAVLSASLLVVALGSGCRAVKTVVDAPGKIVERVASLGRDRSPTVDPVAVQRELLRLTDEMTAQLTREIGGLKIGNKPIEPAKVLQGRIDFGSSTCAIVSGANPVANLLDMTAFLSLTRMGLEEYWVPQFYGESGSVLLARCKAAEQSLWQLTSQVLSSSLRDDFRREVEAWYLKNPRPEDVLALRAAGLATQIIAAKKSGSPHLGSLYDQLIIDPLGGLAPAASEIAQTRLFAERGLYVAQKMPQLLRWQLELLNLNALSSPVVQQVVANTTQLTVAVDRISRVAEQLPAQVDQQREELIKALEAQERQLTPLVGEVRQTLAAGQDMSASLNTTLVTFDALMKRFGVGEPVTPALPAAGAAKARGAPFRIQDYETTAAQLEKTAKQLTELLAEVNQTVSPGNLGRLAEQAAPVVQQAKAGGKEVVDYAFWRGLLFFGIVLLGLGLYRFLCARISSVRR